MTRKIYRSDERMVAGVCSGIGQYFSVDPALIRVGFAVLLLFRGLGLFLYGLCWLILPDQAGDTVLEGLLHDGRWKDPVSDSRLGGLALIVIGMVLLLQAVSPFLTWSMVLSGALVGCGVYLIYRSWKENEDGR